MVPGAAPPSAPSRAPWRRSMTAFPADTTAMHIAILTFDGYNELDSFVAAGILNRMRSRGWHAFITCPTDEVTSMNGVTVRRQRDLEADPLLQGDEIDHDLGHVGEPIARDEQYRCPAHLVEHAVQDRSVQRSHDQDVRGENIRALFLGSMERYQAGRTWDIHHVVVDGDLVALHCTMHALTNVGKEYHGSYHMLFRIEGDRIAEGWEFLDTAYVFECLRPDDES